MNKKYIKLIGMWIGIITGILAIISSIIYIYKELKELIVLTVILLLLSLICFFVLWYKEKNAKETSENKNKRLKKALREKENENKALKKEMCQACKKIYSYAYPKSLSLSENLDECFSPIDEISDKEGEVYCLDEYIFIDFSIRGEGKECYLINLISGLIYLPVDNEWKESKGDELRFYRQLCSNRKIHLDFSQLL